MKFFNLPDLGEGIPDAEIIEWHVKPGDMIEEDQVMVAVETAKAVVDVPSPVSAKVVKLFGAKGDVINTGQPLVEFEVGEDADTGTVVGKIQASADAKGQGEEEDRFFVGNSPSTAQHRVTHMAIAPPAVRAMARQLGVSLADLKPLPGQSLLTVRQIQEAAARQQAGLPEVCGEALRGVRKHMARAMAQSHEQVVPVTLSDKADIHAWPVKTDITLRIIRALISACAQVPTMNAWFDGNGLLHQVHEKIHLSLAIDSPEGLFVPVIEDVGAKTDKEIRKAIEQLKKGVQKRDLPTQAFQGGTISLSNFGTMAGRYANPIVVPPQVCIVGIGAICAEPVVLGDGKTLAAHKIMPISLTFDHRPVTGGEAARFLHALITHLEQSKLP